MARKGVTAKREVLPDPVFKRTMVSKFINYVMSRGKKSVAEKIVYGALDIVKDKTKVDPMEVFDQAVKNVRPTVEVKSRRVGGSTYQVPMEVGEGRAVSLALRWLVSSGQGRSEKTMRDRLAAEIIDAYNKRGGAMTISENKRKMAEANKAFAHYRW